ncbi:cache domain-containing protein [Psychromonas aquimarina]|uniref:cache domain-containing protein n=1 Tax=Psychromonas aquimarina TaxID=444919 RepID=UPI000422A50F|nr:cache domain-containing protein [Psychromonas aquimarina]
MKFSIKTKLIVALCVPLLLIGVVFISSLINTQSAVLAAEQNNVESKVTALLNDGLKGQVDTVTRSISDYYEQSKLENIKKELSVEMTAFKRTIERIYEQSDSESDAAESIYVFLNQHRWNNGRYFFAYDPDTWISKAYGSNLSWVGVNGYEKKDADGNYFVQTVVEAARNNSIGFSQYSFLNPTTKKIEDKITASFYFKPLNLVIASGEYLSTLKQNNIAAALHAISIAKYGKNGYFWIQDKEGTILAHPKSEIVGTIGSTTAIIAAGIRNKPEAFVKTVYENPATQKFENKINYARKIFPEWGWIIVTGAYESDVLTIQNGLTKATNEIFEERTTLMIIVSSILVIFGFIVAIWVISFTLKGIALQKDLINAVSHELRTPIARLRFGVEMMESSPPRTGENRYVTGVQQDIDELEDLVSELLTYARFDRNVSDLQMQSLTIVPWLEDVLAALAAEVSAQLQHVFLVEPNAQGYFEPKHLRRAVSNLVHNAAKYGNGLVVVTLEQRDTEYLLHVDDDGPGIPDADRERVFEPFARVDSSRSRESGGYGLGLAIVKRVLDEHHGSVSNTTSPLGGCRFTIRWQV